MRPDPWFEADLAGIRARLAEAAAAREGLVFIQEKATYRVLVVKAGTQVQLYFAKGGGRTEDVSGIMSRIDLDAPLHLLGAYTQVMLLALLWKPRPARAYVLGFGGGRIPLVLHHYFPELKLESTELDATVMNLAFRFFGVGHDERMKVFVEDGRKFLEQRPRDVKYDMIFVDCFTGAGHHPFSLSTLEFYELCKAHLETGGVAITNLVEADPLFSAKVATFVASFRHVLRYQEDGVNVLFGSDVAVQHAEARARADSVFEDCPFSFPFRELVAHLLPVLGGAAPAGADELLSDGALRAGSAAGIDPTLLAGKRNAPCPCGSGLKYKKCHGL